MNYRNKFLSVITSRLLALAVMMLAIMSVQYSVLAQETAKTRITLEARLSEDTPAINEGIEWRIFSPSPNEDGKMKELAYQTGGAKAFNISPGDYFIHAAYGHAGAVKRITVGDSPKTESLNLNAGGLRLLANSSQQTRIPARLLKFDVYSIEVDKFGDRKLLARNVRPAEINPFPVGTYHIVSRFGELNAEIRADLRVEPGKLTEATLQHRAAMITFRLVRKEGGDALVDTAWSILTENGAVIKESNSTFPTMVLAEGNYTAIAKNNDTIFSQDFEVKSGFNKEVEVLAPN